MKSRRDFLRSSALAGVGLALGSALARGQSRRMGGMMDPVRGVVDPPIGALLRDPPLADNASVDDGVVEVNLVARIASVDVNGRAANLMTFNGAYPGPTIRVRRGDWLRINLLNALPPTTARNLLGFQRNLTSLHVHGLHVSPVEPGDFVMYELKPGEVRHHAYDTSRQEPGALAFYHPHRHGTSAEQYWAGMLGAIVVEDETPLLSPFETHILVLKDLALNGAEPAPHSQLSDYVRGKEGDIVMVNGQVNPRVLLRQGQVQRWRILNGSNARFYRLGLASHTLQLIGTDGGLLDRPLPVSEILLSPGERVDVLVRGEFATGDFRLRALPYARTGMGMGMGMSGGETLTLLTVSAAPAAAPVQLIPPTINPSARRLAGTLPPIAAHHSLTLGMGQANAYINGQDYDTDPFTLESRVGTYELWTVYNVSGMDHPFHPHVNPAQVLSISGGDPVYNQIYSTVAGWKDTVLVPKWGSVSLLVPVRDFSGTTMMHCHIIEHQDIGMMGLWHLEA